MIERKLEKYLQEKDRKLQKEADNLVEYLEQAQKSIEKLKKMSDDGEINRDLLNSEEGLDTAYYYAANVKHKSK